MSLIESSTSYLHRYLHFRLKGEFITHDGKGVNYPMLKESQIFKEYSEKMAPLLQHVKLDNISENEKKAFFISIL